MERKLYLHSAWLFLLCRVVHRALLNDEEEDESSWNSYGLDVEVGFVALTQYSILNTACIGTIPLDTTSMGCCIPISHPNHPQGNTVPEGTFIFTIGMHKL